MWRSFLVSLLYVGYCAVVGFHLPGLEYDEAVSMRGAMEMAVHQPVTTFSPENSLCLGGHCAHLMIAPYVGAAKDYFLLPLFWLFGPTVAVGRFGAALLVSVGIWGIGFFVREQFGPVQGLATGLVLAIHPSVIDLTLYDQGNVAMTFFALGMVGIAAAVFLRWRDSFSVGMLGIACGFAIWCRMNLLWLVAGGVVAAILLSRRAPWRTLLCLAGGVLLGAAPLLVYVAGSASSIGDSFRGARWDASWWQILSVVGPELAETLLSDGEHRAIWMGPAMLPVWQLVFVGSVAVSSLLACLLVRRGTEMQIVLRRVVALTALFYLSMLIVSRLPIAEHHLVVLVPFAAMMACVVPWNRTVLVAALLYVGLAGYWNVRAAQGIRETGGSGQWSSAVYEVADYLQESKASVTLLDWGLAQNLYFLSRTRIAANEIYSETPDPAVWAERVQRGGVYLTSAPAHLHFPRPTQAFVDALKRSGRRYQVKRFFERSGAEYAVLYVVAK